MMIRSHASRFARFQPCRSSLAFLVLLLPIAVSGQQPALASQSEPAIYRLHDGLTLFVSNPEGAGFAFTLDVRDLNLMESGPREVLVKVYDSDGKPVVREVIPDDGITEAASQHPAGAWDHEAWFYAWSRMQGEAPMIRWSSFSDPQRLAAIAKRRFTYQIPRGKPGVYRIVLSGATDHYVSVGFDRQLAYGVSGHATFLHGHGDMLRQSFLYVPQGSKGLHIVTAEWDLPTTRQFKLTAPDGKVLFETDGSRSFTVAAIEFEKGQYDDQLLRLEVTDVTPPVHRPGEKRADSRRRAAEGTKPGDFLIEIKHRFDRDPEVTQRGERAVAAVFAPDEKTARQLRGGAIYHDGRVFWQMYQVRLHDWLKTLDNNEFVVTDGKGEEIDVKDLPAREGFLPLNGNHWRPPLCDLLMHHWPAHRNRAALNLAIRDLIAGLRSIGPNDHVAVAVGGPFANMGYEFSNYAWHYWRPGWRIIQHSDAPEELKDHLREAFLVCGDRLAFCRSWARVNGNSFAQIPPALRYCYEATGDPLQKDLFEIYFDRFANGGWGDRAGIGPSGPVQEGFAYAYHYASYPLDTWRAVLADFQDERFQAAYDRMRIWFSYALADEKIPAGAWSARTHYYPQWAIEREGPFAWKGLPGPPFTVSVNDANEWFAARRENYYALTYHGRLSPKWNSNANAGQCGFGGGMLCQLQIPGRGPVLASTLNGGYGEGMDPSQWPSFHLHSLVGTAADQRPIVAADSEHFDARLQERTVTSSGEIRNSSLSVSRSFSFEADRIRCQVQLAPTGQLPLLNLWTKNPLHGNLVSAYEMIPFVPNRPRQSGRPPELTSVIAFDKEGKDLGELTAEPVSAHSVVIDRGGFGVRVELEESHRVHRGRNNTLLIEIIGETGEPTPAQQAALQYQLVPFQQPADAQ